MSFVARNHPQQVAANGARNDVDDRETGRMRFLCNGATAIKPNERPPFGVCLVIWGAS